MRHARRAVLAALIVAALVVLPAAPASAVTPAPASAPLAPPPDFTPSGNKWRQWMVNLLSSVMGAATPSPYRAEQIANSFIYDHGAWEQMNARFGLDGVRVNEAGDMVGVRRSSIGSGTYTDVVIDGLEQQYKEASARGKGPVRAPATPLKTFAKIAGGSLAVVGGYEVGALLGGLGSNVVGGWLGFDANGTVCSMGGFDNDVQKWIFRTMAGQDCNAWDYENTYIPGSIFTMPASLADFRFVPFTGTNSVAYYAFCGPKTQAAGVAYRMIYTGHPTVSGIDVPWRTAGSAGTAQANCGGGAMYVTFDAAVGVETYMSSIRKTLNGATVSDTPLVKNEVDEVSRCVVDYTDGTSASSASVPYKPSSGMEPAQCPETPDGKTPENVRVETDPVGSTPPTTILDEGVTPEYTEWWQEYPECQIGACSLDLIRLAPTPAVSCFDLEDGCVDWHTDPDKTSKYLCRYGVHDVDLAECNVYAGLFQPGRITTGSPYSDPSTGEWSGGQNAPKPGGQAMNVQLQDPENPRSCNFPDFALDPVSWVLTPVNCSMERNFVPRQTVIEVHVARLDETWRDSMPGQYAAALGGLGDAFGSLGAGHCGGFTVSVPVPGLDGGMSSKSGNLLGSCPGSPLQPLATGIFWLLSGLIVWAGVLALRGMFERFVGFS